MTMPNTEWDGDASYDGDEADQLEQEAAAAGDALEEAASEPQLYFMTLPDFVDQFLIKAYRRHIAPNTPWCSEW